MRVERIEDPGDGRLADYAGVREPRLLRNRGLLIEEGRFADAGLCSAPGAWSSGRCCSMTRR